MVIAPTSAVNAFAYGGKDKKGMDPAGIGLPSPTVRHSTQAHDAGATGKA